MQFDRLTPFIKQATAGLANSVNDLANNPEVLGYLDNPGSNNDGIRELIVDGYHDPDEESTEKVKKPVVKISKERTSYSFIRLPQKVRKQIVNFALDIPVQSLAKDGVEVDSHVTVKYGIKNLTPQEFQKLVKESGISKLTLTIDRLSLFENEDDVLKLEVSGKSLKDLNKYISENTDCIDSYPVFVPHVTIAYLKKGEGKRYIGKRVFDRPQKIVTDFIIFQDPQGKEHFIKLAPKKQPFVNLLLGNGRNNRR